MKKRKRGSKGRTRCVEGPLLKQSGLSTPQVVVVIVVFGWVLAATALGVPVAVLTGLLVATGGVAAHLAGRSGSAQIPDSI